MKGWRVIDTGIIDAPANMALDEVILHAVDEGKAPSTLRIMRFDPPCVLVGYNQNVDDEVKVEFCKENGVPINRRITGGGAILMEPSTVGWEIVAGKGMLPGGSIEDIYAFLCKGCVNALRTLGVPAAFRPHNDIEVNGKKISGTGGTEYGNTFLFHGTILVDFGVELMLNSCVTPLEKLQDKGISAMRERLTWLSRELETVPEADAIIDALIISFSELFGIAAERGSLNEYERGKLAERLPYFQSGEWVFGRGHKGKAHLNFAYKAPGGLIRVFPVVDRGFISSVIINGDFFSYPSRLILDLETCLKNCRISDLENKVDAFFASREWHIPGVRPDDFVTAIRRAVENG
jgi:lipoate---protein ligase